MIKKTFKTLKQHPLILLIYALPIIYGILRYNVFSNVVLPDVLLPGKHEDISLSVMLSWSASLIYYITWIFFMLPLLERYIYRTVSGGTTLKLDLRDLKKYWWRWALLILILTCGVFAFLIPVTFIFGIIYAVTRSQGLYYFIFLADYIVILFIIAFAHTGGAAIFAEDSFGKAFSNAFKAAKKYYLKIFSLTLLAYLPTVIFLFKVNGNGEQLYGGAITAIGIFSTVIVMIINVYSMHCYVEWKNNQQVNQKADDAVSAE